MNYKKREREVVQLYANFCPNKKYEEGEIVKVCTIGEI